jgi:hypothetical protein
MSPISILIIILVLVGLGVGGYFGYKKLFKPTPTSTKRKYSEVKDSKAKKSGKCTGTGTAAKGTFKSSSDCSSACDAAPSSAPCNGYDWDGTTCTLYGTAPSGATYVSKGKDKCYALSK